MKYTLIRTCAMALIVCMPVTSLAYALPPKYWNAPALHEPPRGHHVIRHGGNEFMFHQGRFYRHDHGRIVIVAPPFGAVIPLLSLVGATMLMVGGISYYELNGVYYRRLPEGYVVVEQPPGSPEFIQQNPPAQRDDRYYWYYCREADKYYPYVKQCPGGWMKVVPNTPPPDAGGGSATSPDMRR